MPIIVRCQCGQRFRAQPDIAGKRVKCPSCGDTIDVPIARAKTQPATTLPGSGTQAEVVACQCGQSFKAPPHLMGQTVACLSCGLPISIPYPPASEPSLDGDPLDLGIANEYGDYAEKYSGNTAALPQHSVRPTIPTMKLPTRRKTHAVSMSAVLRILGQVFRVFAVLYLVFAIPGALLGFLLFKWFGLAIMFVSIMFCVLGMKGAVGQGIPVSRETTFEGDASIVAGMVLIVRGTATPSIVFAITKAAFQ